MVDWQPAMIRWDPDKKQREAWRKLVSAVAFSPRGDQASFLALDGQKVDLGVVPLAGGEERLLVRALGLRRFPEVSLYPPAWSPDGKRIAYTAKATEEDSTKDFEVWIVDVAGGGKSRVSVPGEPSFGPVWSKDGRTIYYSVDRDEKTRRRVRRVLVEETKAEDVPGGDGGFAGGLSPDGRLLAVRRLLREPGTGQMPENPKHRVPLGGENASCVRLLDLGKGKWTDNPLDAFQHLCAAYTDYHDAEAPYKAGQKEESIELLRRAAEILDRMEKRFPGSGDRAEAKDVRKKVADLLERMGAKKVR